MTSTDHYMAAMSKPPAPKRPIQRPASNSTARKRQAEREAQA